jgi:CheY-like chemotaxis protein
MAEDDFHRILIVPPTLVQGELGSSFLDRAALRVRTAATGAEALGISRAWAPALIIIGSRLTDTTAAELATRIRREVDPDIKLLMLTDLLESATADDEVEPDGHLIEPVDPPDLLAAVAELLGVDARRSPRVAVRILARLAGVFEEPARESGLANLLSLSEKGALVEAPGQLRLGAEGTLQFVIPQSGVRLTLPIRPRVLIDEIRLHYGTEFVALDEESRGHLRALVAARIGSAAAEEDAVHEFDRD